MKKLFFTFIIALCFYPVHLFSQDNTKSDKHPLIGEWTIDLRPSPDAEGYYQTFTISSIEDKIIEGSFYGSTISNGLVNSNWNRLYFAFTTSDASNTYYHSGYLDEGRVYGITYCPNREFTAPWNGVKLRQ